MADDPIPPDLTDDELAQLEAEFRFPFVRPAVSETHVETARRIIRRSIELHPDSAETGEALLLDLNHPDANDRALRVIYHYVRTLERLLAVSSVVTLFQRSGVDVRVVVVPHGDDES